MIVYSIEDSITAGSTVWMRAKFTQPAPNHTFVDPARPIPDLANISHDSREILDHLSDPG